MKLTNSTLFRRQSLVNLDDCLVQLEHSTASDRVRRIYFDRVSAVAVWKTVPWIRIVVVTVLFALPGALMQRSDEIVLRVIGGVLLVLGVGAAGWWTICRRTHLLICRGTRRHTIVVTATPGRIARFRREITEAIRRVQSGQAPEPAESTESTEPTETPE